MSHYPTLPTAIAVTPETLGSVLIVEDNHRISQECALVLEEAGFKVRCALDGTEMRTLLCQGVPDITLLDLNLPHEDGISLCKWLRGIYLQMGIVMLTARVMGSDRTEGYEAGADVYLTKPTRPAELLAVMRNLVKRARGSKSPIQKEGSHGASWMLNVASMNLIGPSHEILSLTPKEVKVLGILAQSPAAQSYQDILERVQTGEAVLQDKAKLEVLISRLRQKLARLHNHEFEIKTVHGTGYQLLTPVQVMGR